MIRLLIRHLWMIRTYDRIPKLPRGMLSSRYDSVSHDERRVMARLGARDPRGVQVRLRRAGVETVDELVSQLDHYQPKRRFRQRVLDGIGRLTNALPYHPYKVQILADAREESHRVKNPELDERLKRAIREMK